MCKKWISMLLTVCIISGISVTAVFADEAIDEASVYTEDSQYVSGDARAIRIRREATAKRQGAPYRKTKAPAKRQISAPLTAPTRTAPWISQTEYEPI